MSGRDPKAELGAIARGLRRRLELEGAAGTGGVLAASAAKLRGKAAKTAVARGTATVRAPEGALESTVPPGERVVSAADRVETDLFGRPSKPPRASAPFVEPEVMPEFPRSPAAVPLAPAGSVGRASLLSSALPVLEEVAAEARACRRCGLCETRTQAVPGVGSAASGIVFVGEAPGADEDRRGEPFVGRAGELLTKIIQAMDEKQLIPGMPLNRETVYICNVLKCRPPENRNPLPHEVEACAPYLKRQLAALEPRIICCLGKFAAELLIGVKGTIGGLRGKVYRYQGAKLIVTYHPAYCLRNPEAKRPVWEDMQLLAREYLADV